MGWSLRFGVFLELGIWCLVLSASDELPRDVRAAVEQVAAGWVGELLGGGLFGDFDFGPRGGAPNVQYAGFVDRAQE